MTPDSSYRTALYVAGRLGISTYTVGKRVRDGSFPHVRVGPEPEPGRRDVRPVLFTPEQVDEIEARHFHFVPAKDGAA